MLCHFKSPQTIKYHKKIRNEEKNKKRRYKKQSMIHYDEVKFDAATIPPILAHFEFNHNAVLFIV